MCRESRGYLYFIYFPSSFYDDYREIKLESEEIVKSEDKIKSIIFQSGIAAVGVIGVVGVVDIEEHDAYEPYHQ